MRQGRGESPANALRRELREEVGLEVEVGRLLALEPSRDERQLQVGYVCQARGDVARLGAEILSARWMPPGELPDPILPFHRALVARAACWPAVVPTGA